MRLFSPSRWSCIPTPGYLKYLLWSSFFFFASLQSTKKRKKERKEKKGVQPWRRWNLQTPLTDTCVFFYYFRYSKQRQSTKFRLHVTKCPRLRERSRAGAAEVLCFSHSVTGQLLPSSEVVDEHRHTVCAHQVVWVSGERFVLPSFGITWNQRGHTDTQTPRQVAVPDAHLEWVLKDISNT